MSGAIHLSRGIITPRPNGWTPPLTVLKGGAIFGWLWGDEKNGGREDENVVKEDVAKHIIEEMFNTVCGGGAEGGKIPDTILDESDHSIQNSSFLSSDKLNKDGSFDLREAGSLFNATPLHSNDFEEPMEVDDYKEPGGDNYLEEEQQSASSNDSYCNMGRGLLEKLDRDFLCSPRKIVRGVYRNEVLKLVVKRKLGEDRFAGSGPLV